MRTILAVSFILALTACDGGGTGVSRSTTSNVTGSFQTDLNAHRSSNGQSSVRPQAQLQRAANAHATDMVRRGYFSHQSPDGGTLSARIAASGYNACGGAENIARGQTSEGEVFASWRQSAGHNKNLLGNFTDYGIARVNDTWVMVLARRC